jgi:TolB-like protein
VTLYPDQIRRVFSGGPTKPIRSLAVLPLVNLSGDADQEYFADGMTDELIGQLMRINSLRVISRTSVMRFKGTRKSVAEIARDLDVDAVVEGAVIRSPERVRVTAQLIRASSDSHLWAERYERPPGDTVICSARWREISDAIRIELTLQERTRLADVVLWIRKLRIIPQGRYWSKRTEEATQKISISTSHRTRSQICAGSIGSDSYISLAARTRCRK